jgi:hypothetical protein
MSAVPPTIELPSGHASPQKSAAPKPRPNPPAFKLAPPSGLQLTTSWSRSVGTRQCWSKSRALDTFRNPCDCELTGQDRCVAVVDDNGVEQRFMDHPRNVGTGAACQGRIREHPEALLWIIFEQPRVFTIADTRPDLVEANRQRLLSFETAHALSSMHLFRMPISNRNRRVNTSFTCSVQNAATTHYP